MQVTEIALRMRQEIFKMAMHANGGHIAPAFSMTDILAELYFDDILRYDVSNPSWAERDFFILSKGHGVLALYVALALAGFFPREKLNTFCKIGSSLGGLARMDAVPGVEASTGSLGHGLSFAVGIALACKLDCSKNHIYALLGDGECQEGSIWEGFMAASHYNLDNLTVIIDNNGLQAMDSIDTILSAGNFLERLQAFGFAVMEIDGHNYRQIKMAMQKRVDNKPCAIIAHTVKGKGVSFMENEPIWHYRIPRGKEVDIALQELGMTSEKLGKYENVEYINII